MSANRNVLTPEALTMMDVIARTGSFAAAARGLGKVPSSLSYSERQLEDALDVLLFVRRSRQARLTAAGAELLLEGRHLLEQTDAVANRVERVATGWEAQLSIAVDDGVSTATALELCEAFFALEATAASNSIQGGASPRRSAGTRLALRTEALAGTWEAQVSGRADLALGVGTDRSIPIGIRMKELGPLCFVFANAIAIAPHHPLAAATAPLTDAERLQHRAVAVAASAQRLVPRTFNLLTGQDVLTVSDMRSKIEALLRGMGCGFVPEPLPRGPVAADRLVVKAVQRLSRGPVFGYAGRRSLDTPTDGRCKREPGLGLRWCLGQFESPATRHTLLERHAAARSGGA